MSEREQAEREQAPDEQPEPAATPMDEPAPDAEPLTPEEAPEPEESQAAAGSESRTPMRPSEPGGTGREAEDSDGTYLASLERERDEYLDLAQRTRAELDNYRKRVAREAEETRRRAVAELAHGLLPVVDNLERALAAAPDAESELTTGVQMVHRDLLGALNRVGIEPFEPDAGLFDPSEHEAVTALPSENGESGQIIEVLERGYRFGDQVLRAARVVVTK